MWLQSCVWLLFAVLLLQFAFVTVPLLQRLAALPAAAPPPRAARTAAPVEPQPP